MDPQVVGRLIAINREFYARFALEFSETRHAEQIGLKLINPYLSSGSSLLDVGCGNGRLAERLDQEGYRLTYVGIDAAPKLIQIARAKLPSLHQLSATYHVSDVTSPGWTNELQPFAPFDVAFALALLHHIPGSDLRLNFLRDIYSLLSPDGVLIMSNWQFMQDERLQRKIIPWPTVGIDSAAVEPGDALLDWRRGGLGYRYVHQFTMPEVESLAVECGFQAVDQFLQDEQLNLFSVLKRAD